jgi:hypothetical protein
MSVQRAIRLFLTYGPPLALWFVFVGGCALSAIHEPDPTSRRQTVAGSALLTIYCMILGWQLLCLPTTFPFGALIPLARFIWSLGFLTLVIHILIAFGVAHGWSHAAAVEHIRQVGGFGGGIVVNYLFAAVWLADLVWWWVNPTNHASRPKWVGWVVHGFLAFVVVNATVVFGSPIMRSGYVFGLVLTLLWWLAAPTLASWLWKVLGKANEPSLQPGSDEKSRSHAGHSPT